MIIFNKIIDLIKSNIFMQIAILVVVGVLALNWYTDGKIDDAFSEFREKAVEIIKGDKDAVDAADKKLGNRSILDGIFGSDVIYHDGLQHPDTDNTPVRQDCCEGYDEEIPNAKTNSANSSWVEGNSRTGAAVELLADSMDESPEENTARARLLQLKGICGNGRIEYSPDGIDGMNFVCVYSDPTEK